MPGKLQRADIDLRDLRLVDERPAIGNAPSDELAVLRARELPPARRVSAAPVAEVAGRGPDSDLDAVDPQADVGGPIGIRPRRLRRHFHAEFEFANTLLEQARIVGKLVLDEPATEPGERG